MLSVVDTRDAVALAFRLVGRHVGPLGVRIELRVTDILTLTDGRITALWMVGDWLTPLAEAGLIQVLTKPASAGRAAPSLRSTPSA